MHGSCHAIAAAAAAAATPSTAAVLQAGVGSRNVKTASSPGYPACADCLSPLGDASHLLPCRDRLLAPTLLFANGSTGVRITVGGEDVKSQHHAAEGWGRIRAPSKIVHEQT